MPSPRGERLIAAVVCIGLLVATGCASDEAADDATTAAPATAQGDQAEGDDATDDRDGSDSTAGTAPAAAAASPLEGPLADAVFLTAVDEVVAGTVYEGLVDAAPGEFLLTATLVCERLAEGRSRTDVLDLYLDALGAGRPTDDDARLAGALVGASIEVYCPDHFT